MYMESYQYVLYRRGPYQICIISAADRINPALVSIPFAHKWYSSKISRFHNFCNIKVQRRISVQQKEIFPIVFTRKLCIKVENQPCFSRSLLLIITDGRIRRMQVDTKAVYLPCSFGASSPQAFGVTHKLA